MLHNLNCTVHFVRVCVDDLRPKKSQVTIFFRIVQRIRSIVFYIKIRRKKIKTWCTVFILISSGKWHSILVCRFNVWISRGKCNTANDRLFIKCFCCSFWRFFLLCAPIAFSLWISLNVSFCMRFSFRINSNHLHSVRRSFNHFFTNHFMLWITFIVQPNNYIITESPHSFIHANSNE